MRKLVESLALGGDATEYDRYRGAQDSFFHGRKLGRDPTQLDDFLPQPAERLEHECKS
jgi:hypothetical protein